jgi:IclR family acetate operon transcriptional repressor
LHYRQIKRKLFPRYRKRSRDGHYPFPRNAAENPAATAQQAGGQVQSLTRGLKLLEWIAESHSSVALTELAQHGSA